MAHCAKKLGEEAIETVLAAVQEDKARLVSESGDLLYHLFVLLKARGITLAEVESELARRTAQSGHEEKARARLTAEYGTTHARQPHAVQHLLARRNGRRCEKTRR